MADPFEMAEHRHPRLGLDALHQRAAAARDDQVDMAAEPGEQSADGRAVGGRHDLDAVRRQARFDQPRGDCFADREAGGEGVGAAAQDQGIARAQADRGGVGGDVRPAFEDHPDHADRRPHPGEVEPVRPPPARRLGPERIRQVRDRRDRGGDRVEPRLVEAEPVDQPRRLRYVLRIGGEDRACAGAQLPSDRADRGAAQGRVRPAQHPRRGARFGAHLLDHRASITRSSRWIKASGPP
jgi:hypothetical protein